MAIEDLEQRLRAVGLAFQAGSERVRIRKALTAVGILLARPGVSEERRKKLKTLQRELSATLSGTSKRPKIVPGGLPSLGKRQ